jgi:hypothetical protein
VTAPRRDHACPGCRRRQVPVHQLSCRGCWFRLPQELRTALNNAYHRGTPDEHADAMRACLDWYRDHPIGVS